MSVELGSTNVPQTLRSVILEVDDDGNFYVTHDIGTMIRITIKLVPGKTRYTTEAPVTGIVPSHARTALQSP